jgi:hypothetical protein
VSALSSSPTHQDILDVLLSAGSVSGADNVGLLRTSTAVHQKVWLSDVSGLHEMKPISLYSVAPIPELVT